MNNKKKIGCLIYYYGTGYKNLAENAYNSFIKWNGNEVETHFISPDKYEKEIGLKNTKSYVYALAYWKRYNYTKMIILGADTMTCSRLDEFIDDDEHDIIASLDYPYKGHKFKMTKENEVLAKKDFIHVNSDVVCFNNQQALEDIIANSTAGPYYEQGGLNKIIWTGYNNYTFIIVDHPYLESKVVYNTRSKGNICSTSRRSLDCWDEYIKLWHVKNDKLFTGLHKNNPNVDKQIKVFHFCEGMSHRKAQQIIDIANKFWHNYFNEETKEFLKTKCNCKWEL